MSFDETPNYKLLIKLFEQIVIEDGDDVDMVFDWMMPRFYGKIFTEPETILKLLLPESSDDNKSDNASESDFPIKFINSFDEKTEQISVRLQEPKESQIALINGKRPAHPLSQINSS